MSCPFRHLHNVAAMQKYPPSTEEEQNLANAIYNLESDIIRKKSEIAALRKKSNDIAEEKKKKEIGTVDNVEAEIKKLTNNGNRTGRPLFHRYNKLFNSILYTLKNMEEKINQLMVLKSPTSFEPVSPTSLVSDQNKFCRPCCPSVPQASFHAPPPPPSSPPSPTCLSPVSLSDSSKDSVHAPPTMNIVEKIKWCDDDDWCCKDTDALQMEKDLKSPYDDKVRSNSL